MFLLSYRISPAAENMASDLAMLSSWKNFEDAPRLRFYGWAGDCFTCGISQNAQEAAKILPAGAEVARRPSGGGIVDHRKDLTYALVINSAHPMCKERAADSYRDVHAAIAGVLAALGFAASLYSPPECANKKPPMYQCFASPSKFDVMLGQIKIAGAAQKRNRCGILFQGSINAEPLRGVSREVLIEKLAEGFASMLGQKIERVSIADALSLQR